MSFDKKIASAFSRFDAVVFDAGGVILNWKPAEVVAKAFSDPVLGKKVFAASVSHPRWHKFDEGTISYSELSNQVCKEAGINSSEFEKLYACILEELTPIKSTVDCIHTLKSLGKKLVLLSNMPGPIWEHLSKTYSVWKMFDGLVLSFEIKLIKPELAIYRHLLEKHALTAEKSIFLDDREENVVAAREIGMASEVFESVEQLVGLLGQ